KQLSLKYSGVPEFRLFQYFNLVNCSIAVGQLLNSSNPPFFTKLFCAKTGIYQKRNGSINLLPFPKILKKLFLKLFFCSYKLNPSVLSFCLCRSAGGIGFKVFMAYKC